ncbi:hypothetical protein DSO57_1021269 [Entomophthora muscae]|uniref:Uncharacterized protein n=1 Tax=Entomophthora muscae TaxID=34485 RepID=A0ACC2S5L0_9FUNG|nr:hypothetical protein DSO57_1021269 [Entomophthora muscae]
MEPPVTPKPMPASSPDLPTNHISKLFGIVYITLTGVVDTIVLAAGQWSWLGKSASYLLKLAPLLWWALPAKNLAQVTSKTGGPPTQEWVPDSMVAYLRKYIKDCRKLTAPINDLTKGNSKKKFIWNVTKVTVLRPRAGIEPAPSHQAGLAGRGDLPAPRFFFLKKIQVQESFLPWWQLRGSFWAPKATPKPWWVWLGMGRLFLAAQ